MLKDNKHLFNLHESTFINFFLSLWDKMAWKTCLLLIFEHLRFFAKAMTRDDKHFLCNTWNLQELY